MTQPPASPIDPRGVTDSVPAGDPALETYREYRRVTRGIANGRLRSVNLEQLGYLVGQPRATRKLIDLCTQYGVPVISPTGAIDVSTLDGQSRLRRQLIEDALPAQLERRAALGDLTGLRRAVIDARIDARRGDDRALAVDQGMAETWLGYLGKRFGGDLPEDVARERARWTAQLETYTDRANRPQPLEGPRS